MLYSDLYGKLVILTKRSDITHVEIGRCINLEKGAVTARAKRNAKIKDEELKLIESAFGTDLSEINVCANSLKQQNDTLINKKISEFNTRLLKIQTNNNLQDKDMAEILGIYENDYINLKKGSLEPSFKILNNIKQHFEVSIDWLLYGGGAR